MADIIDMPKLSDTMTVGTLVRWLKKEGELVEAGEMLAEVETDKATMEVENFTKGVVLKHYVKQGEAVPIGAPMCAIGKKGETAPEAPAKPAAKDAESAASTSSAKTVVSPTITAVTQSAATHTPTATTHTPATYPTTTFNSANSHAAPVSGSANVRVKSSPLARKLALERGIDLSQVKGTGPGGRIIRNDVLSAPAQTKSASSASGARPAAAAQPRLSAPFVLPSHSPIAQDKNTPVSGMRATIARRLLESKTHIPHFYLEIEVDAGPLTQMRESLNSNLGDVKPEHGGFKLTVNDLILKATVEAIRRVPEVNVSWQGDSIVQHGGVHLAFGVAIEDGLVTPVIRNAHTMNLRQINQEAKVLIQKAREKKLKPEEMSGSTFTITNLGMFGITNFYGIINPPNAAILSIGASRKIPVVDANNNITVGHRMNIGISGDHRVVDGAVLAKFLNTLKETLESPSLMLI
jgi:pyruvate dehydrogenase E2 component (dihydrolipoamide acetyltransferase)